MGGCTGSENNRKQLSPPTTSIDQPERTVPPVVEGPEKEAKHVGESDANSSLRQERNEVVNEAKGVDQELVETLKCQKWNKKPKKVPEEVPKVHRNNLK